MSEFKVIIETNETTQYSINSDTPQRASKLALNQFLQNGSLNEVNEVLVLDPEDELGFNMPILQLHGDRLKDLISESTWQS